MWPGVQCGGLAGRSQVFSLMDYRKAPGIQDGGLEGRSQVFSLLDYREGPGCSGWWITRKAPSVQNSGL